MLYRRIKCGLIERAVDMSSKRMLFNRFHRQTRSTVVSNKTCFLSSVRFCVRVCPEICQTLLLATTILINLAANCIVMTDCSSAYM